MQFTLPLLLSTPPIFLPTPVSTPPVHASSICIFVYLAGLPLVSTKHGLSGFSKTKLLPCIKAG